MFFFQCAPPPRENKMRAYRSQVRAPKCWLAENLLLYHMVKELFSLRATRKWTEIFHQFCENELEDCSIRLVGLSKKDSLSWIMILHKQAVS